MKEHKKGKEGAKDVVLEAFKSASMEDKIWMVWKKYNRQIILGIAVIVFGFIGIEGISFYKKSQVLKLEEDYQEAVLAGKQLEFARSNKGEPLAGTVFVEEGDRLVSEAQYEDAIKQYDEGLISLEKTPLGDRERLSIALATFMSGNRLKAKELLEGLMRDVDRLGAIRAEAAYQLALISLEDGDNKGARGYLDEITKIPYAGIWGQKGSLLRESTAGVGSH